MSVVYFIRGGPMIKIGWTRSDDASSRLAELQTGSPVRLKLLATMAGDDTTEAEMHARFGHLRAHGEWFRATEELRSYIRSIGTEIFEERRAYEANVRALHEKGSRARPVLTQAERRRLAGATALDLRTIRRWETGIVRESTAKNLRDQARRLGLPVPEHRT